MYAAGNVEQAYNICVQLTSAVLGTSDLWEADDYFGYYKRKYEVVSSSISGLKYISPSINKRSNVGPRLYDVEIRFYDENMDPVNIPVSCEGYDFTENDSIQTSIDGDVYSSGWWATGGVSITVVINGDKVKLDLPIDPTAEELDSMEYGQAYLSSGTVKVKVS